jgi:Domain of unknown function (DUF4386)
MIDSEKEMIKYKADASPLFQARLAGFLYLIIIIIGVLNGLFVDSKLIVSGNDSLTVNNILANDFLFRIGILSVLVMYAGVVILSWALYILLKKVNKNLALLAMIFRSGEAILGAATMIISFIILLLLNGSAYTEEFGIGKLEALVGVFLNVRTAGLDIVLLFVGLGGTIFCYLFFISMYVPRVLAIWGIFTYLSMIVLSAISILFPNHPEMLEIVFYSLGGLFEIIFGFWLLIKGVKI